MPFMIDHFAALIKKRHSTQFQSIDDLAKQSKVKYAVLAGGSTESYYRNSKISIHQRIWAAIQREGNASRVGTTSEGIERVLASSDEHPVAFLSESAVFKYVITLEGRCDLKVIEAGYNPRYLSLAVPIGSEYFDRLSLAVMEMADGNELTALRSKWWFEKGVGPCHHPSVGSQSFRNTKPWTFLISTLILAVGLLP